MIAKLRNRLVIAVKQGNDDRAMVHLVRLNHVMAIARNRNLSNGMPGNPWVAVTLDQAKRDIQKKGL